MMKPTKLHWHRVRLSNGRVTNLRSQISCFSSSPPEPSSPNVPSSGATAAKPPLPINLDRQTSQNQSQTSSSSHPTTSHAGSQRRRILQPTHPIGEPPTTISTRPIVSRNGSQKSSADPTLAPYQNGTSNIHPFNQLPSTHSYPSKISIIEQNETFEFTYLCLCFQMDMILLDILATISELI